MNPNTVPSSSEKSLRFIPLEVDLSLHAVPALALSADFLLLERKFSRYETRYLAPLIVVLAAVWYGSWVEYCAGFNGTCELLSCSFNREHV